jgi:hypothetical protein
MSFICFVNYFIANILLKMSHNVPAVCDSLSEQRRGNGAKRNDLAIAEASGPLGPEAHTVLLRLSEKQLNNKTCDILIYYGPL